MRVIDLFSGIGGFSIGLERAGMETVAFSEINDFCADLLSVRWPGVPNLGDISKVENFPDADIIVGGFPCQDVSFAGRRAGVSGERSGLYREMLRAIRMVRPKFSIMENVAALLTDGMGRVLGDVAEDGYDAEWDCIQACDIGAPHGRDRVWIALADANEFQRPLGCGEGVGRRQRCAEETAQAGNADSLGKLQSPRLLGEVRRWIDNTTGPRDWWACDWQTKFEALRGMDDGVPAGLDRQRVNASGVRALGNAVVPFIPEAWGRAIMRTQI